MSKDISTTPEQRLANVIEELIDDLTTLSNVQDMVVTRINDMAYVHNQLKKRIEALEARNGSIGDK